MEGVVTLNKTLILNNLNRLYDLMESKNEKLVDLGCFERKGHCGTLHCTLGWASMDDHFIAQGLSLEGGIVSVNNRSLLTARLNLDPIFGPESYDRVFRPYDQGQWDYKIQQERQKSLSSKQLALHRIEEQLEFVIDTL